MTDSPDVLAQLTECEEARRAAWMNRDKQTLSDLMAEDFMEINYFGRLSREDILNDLFPKLTLNFFSMEDYKLIEACEGCATITYRCNEKITFEGSEVQGDFHVAATYARRDDRWRLLLWQITPFNG